MGTTVLPATVTMWVPSRQLRVAALPTVMPAAFAARVRPTTATMPVRCLVSTAGMWAASRVTEVPSTATTPIQYVPPAPIRAALRVRVLRRTVITTSR